MAKQLVKEGMLVLFVYVLAILCTIMLSNKVAILERNNSTLPEVAVINN